MAMSEPGEVAGDPHRRLADLEEAIRRTRMERRYSGRQSNPLRSQWEYTKRQVREMAARDSDGLVVALEMLRDEETLLMLQHPGYDPWPGSPSALRRAATWEPGAD